MKKIKLSLTGIGSVLTENAEKKLQKGEDYQIPTCDNGLTEEQYLDMSMPLPESLVEKLKKQDKGIELKEEDFQEVYSDVSIFNTDILLMVGDEGGTTIFVRDSDITLTVLEEVDQIEDYIEYMSRSWFTKIVDFFRILFSCKQ